MTYQGITVVGSLVAFIYRFAENQANFYRRKLTWGPKIRVHLQDRHTPIYGDDVYGLPDWNKRLSQTHQIDRPLLHAYKLTLEHPVTGELMEFTAPLDSDMARVAKSIVPQGSEQVLSELLTW